MSMGSVKIITGKFLLGGTHFCSFLHRQFKGIMLQRGTIVLSKVCKIDFIVILLKV